MRILFRVAESEAFKDFVKALYPTDAKVLPSAKTLSGTLLDKQHEKCSKHISDIIKESTNLTLTSDGWIFLYVGGHFRYSPRRWCSRRSNYLCSWGNWAKQIRCYCHWQCLSDEAAWDILEEKHSHISAYGCTSHAANLIVQDILQIPDHFDTIKEAEKIIKFVKNYHIGKSMYETKRKAAKVVPHTLMRCRGCH